MAELVLTGTPWQRYNWSMLRKETDVTGVILVGGKSRRMGTDKAFLEIDGTPLFERVLGMLGLTFAETILIGDHADRFARYGLPIYPDIYPGSALGGLYTGLAHARSSHIFVSACDVPFASGSVARHLASLREGFDAVVPKSADGYEPLFAVYSKNCLEPMRRFLEKGGVCIFDLFPDLHVRYVQIEELTGLDGGEETFVNVNTPEEFERVIRNVR